MPVGVGSARRGVAQVALLAGVLTGCAGAGDGDPKTRASASAAEDAAGGGAAAVKSGGTIGAAGTACELPVAFDIAKGWKAQAVDWAAGGGASSGGTADGSGGDAGDELPQEVADAILRQGPVTAACEIDAKPAGNIGFLRVWTGRPGDDDARTVLQAFVAAEDHTSKARYRTFRAGELTGVEVEYLFTSELLDETKEESALAVTTAHGPVVLHLGGMDTDEHRAMLPAYELAKRTLRAT